METTRGTAGDLTPGFLPARREGTHMWNRILFPTDGRDGATAVFERVLDVAETHDATLHVLNVADTTHDSVTRLGGDVVDVLEGEGERIVDEAGKRARERGVETVTEVLQGRVPETIATYAKRYDVDLVIMPTSGRTGLGRMVLGSVTENVIRRTTVPVLALRPGDEEVGYPYREVLVSTDGSAGANAALERGIGVANAHGGTLHLLSVVDVGGVASDVFSGEREAELEAEARRTVEEAASTARRAGVESIRESVESDADVPGAIVSYVEENGIDLVAIGTSGRAGLEERLLGGVAETVVRTVPVPVLAVPGE
ncbi:MAG: universal stress protein [Haloferacaceae archaeon]